MSKVFPTWVGSDRRIDIDLKGRQAPPDARANLSFTDITEPEDVASPIAATRQYHKL